MEEIFRKNRIKEIKFVLFSVTPDIRSINPATIFREKFNFPKLPIMCLQEAIFNNSPVGIIRVLVFCESENKNFVYLHRAKNLRRDAAWDLEG